MSLSQQRLKVLSTTYPSNARCGALSVASHGVGSDLGTAGDRDVL